MIPPLTLKDRIERALRLGQAPEGYTVALGSEGRAAIVYYPRDDEPPAPQVPGGRPEHPAHLGLARCRKILEASEAFEIRPTARGSLQMLRVTPR